MRFMLFVKASKESEAGIPPSKELVAEMMKLNEEMAQAGILRGLDGLHPSSKGARITFENGQKVVTDGPFTETKELVAGYWLIEVSSKEEAISWALKCPSPMGPGSYAQIEIRQVFDISDFPAEIIDLDAIDRVTTAMRN